MSTQVIPFQQQASNSEQLVQVKDGQVFTTTLAVAEGVGNEHKAVIQLVRKYRNDIEDFGPITFEMWKGKALPQGGFARPTEFALLNEQQATLLITYMKNTEVVRGFKKRLVKAFFDMAEALKGDPIADINWENPRQITGLLVEAIEHVQKQQKQIGQLQEQVEEQRPKAQALDRIATSDGSLCITNAAKDLQVRPKDLFALMSKMKWIYRRSGGAGWIAYQDKIQQGLLEHKVTTVERSDGTEKTTEQVRVTPKGLAKLAKIIEGCTAA